MPTDVLVPILRRTEYREQHEKKFERTVEYVQVQRRILKHLDAHDIAITSRHAYKWTVNVVPRSQQPQPVQALRLCYYMRSLGFDAFADIKASQDPESGTDDTMLRLFVVNRDSEERGLGHDYLYWVQRIRTGEAIPNAYKLQRPGTTTRARRPRLRLDLGAVLSSHTSNYAFDQRWNGGAQMRGGEAAEQPLCGLPEPELEQLQALQRESIVLRTQ